MNTALIDKIADAVLYEGYILYPYRPSTKNRQRWTFGGVFPRAWCEHARAGDKSCASTECVLVGSEAARLSVKLRYLQLVSREVQRLPEPFDEWSADRRPIGEPVASLHAGDESWHTWQEATEREIATGPVALCDLARSPLGCSFGFPAVESVEPLHAADGRVVGLLVRRQAPLSGTLELTVAALGDDLWRIGAQVTNDTEAADAVAWSRDEALMHSFASTHLVLWAEPGSFVSSIDPPEALRAAVDRCRHEGLWPVLVGEAGETDALLAAPIILYDYPQIAPESAGDLFDGTEIDEILSLRILTLSDEEKQAVRSVDARARAMLERTESLDADRFAALHGTVRELRPLKEPGDATLR